MFGANTEICYWNLITIDIELCDELSMKTFSWLSYSKNTANVKRILKGKSLGQNNHTSLVPSFNSQK